MKPRVLGVIVEAVQEIAQLLPVGELNTQDLVLVLEKDRRLRVFEDRVRERVAALDLFPDLSVQVIGRVLRLPVAARQAVLIAQRAIRPNRAAGDLGTELRDQDPLLRLRRFGQQVLKRRPQRGFMPDSLLAEAGQRFVIRCDRLVSRFDGLHAD